MKKTPIKRFRRSRAAVTSIGFLTFIRKWDFTKSLPNLALSLNFFLTAGQPPRGASPCALLNRHAWPPNQQALLKRQRLLSLILNFGICFEQQSLRPLLTVVDVSVLEGRRVARKELFGGTKK